jgi:hypothetical protein
MKILSKLITFIGTKKLISLALTVLEILVKRTDNKLDDKILVQIEEKARESGIDPWDFN